MITEPTDNYLSPYIQAELDHGADFGVTLWASERSQRLRFRVMTEMVFMMGKRVLDAGCSRGDFAAYLQGKEIAFESFVGVDAVQPVIAHANNRGLSRSRFITGDFVSDPSFLSIGQPQVIAISGTLNTMDEAMAIALLDHAWQATGETLVFNFCRTAPRLMRPLRRRRQGACRRSSSWIGRYVRRRRCGCDRTTSALATTRQS